MPSLNSAAQAFEQGLRPRLRVGVTGHRFLAESGKLLDGLRQACERIESRFPGASWLLISPLAEGTDRLVAGYLLERGANLLVPLPLPIETYLEDFPEPESKQEFFDLLKRAEEVVQLPPAATRDAAYLQVGRYILKHCDVLIALWDGQEAQGQGGTGEIVPEARQLGLPLAWVHCGNRRPGTMEPLSLGAEQGLVTFERL
ncbi:MAG: hypothetical protein JW726_15775 [Anaerolineales bacterium]|nr:hypothetical protein [Anaerolineales bacterium]